MDEEETNIVEHDEGEEKEGDAGIEEEKKEETNGDEEEQQEEEYKKKREEEWIEIEGEENKEEPPRVSPEAPEREVVANLNALSTPIKQNGKRMRQTLYMPE